MDGDIDSSSYTRAQLQEAIGNIDAARFPQNLENLRHALELRPAEPEEAAPAGRKHRMWLRRLNQFGGLQLFTGGFLLCFAVVIVARLTVGTAGVLFMAGVCALILLNVVAGFLTFSGSILGYRLSIVNAALQMFSFSINGISFGYRSIARVHVSGFLVEPWLLTAGVGPAIELSVGQATPAHLGLDLFAVALVLAYAWAIRAARRGVTAG